MSADANRAWVIVVGATGYMGRQVCRALRRRGICFAIAGRDARKLALLSESLGGVEQCVVDTQSVDALRVALDRRLLVCACAGPFLEVGEPVLRAAAELGVHYIDVSREQSFALRAFDRYDAVARASKACIAPSMGFESAPADWAAALLAERLGGALDTLDIVYVVRSPSAGPAASRGALRSRIATLGRGDAQQHLGGALRPEHDGAVVRRFATLDDGDVTASSFAGIEAALVPSHVAVGELRTFYAMPPLAARAVQLTRHLAPAVARAGRGAVERLLAYASEGPDIATRGETRFEIILQARRGEASARAHLKGTDPYAVAAEIQAHAAEAALAGYVDASGVVPPSAGYPALAALASLGHVLSLQMHGDQLAPVRTLKSIRPTYVRARSAAHSRHSWHTIVA